MTWVDVQSRPAVLQIHFICDIFPTPTSYLPLSLLFFFFSFPRPIFSFLRTSTPFLYHYSLHFLILVFPFLFLSILLCLWIQSVSFWLMIFEALVESVILSVLPLYFLENSQKQTGRNTSLNYISISVSDIITLHFVIVDIGQFIEHHNQIWRGTVSKFLFSVLNFWYW